MHKIYKGQIGLTVSAPPVDISKINTDPLKKAIQGKQPKVKGQGFSNFFNGITESLGGMGTQVVSSGMNFINDTLEGALNNATTYDGEYGGLTQGLDETYDAASDVLMKTGDPITMAVGLGMKGLKGIDRIVSSATGGFFNTDGNTGIDAALNSMWGKTLLAPISMLNGALGSTTDTISKDEEAFGTVGSSYGGTGSTVDDAVSKSGKKYGLLSTGKRKEADALIDEADRQQDIMSDIADEEKDRQAIVQSTPAINANRRQLQMQGGARQAAMRRGKFGMSIELMNRAKKIINYKPELKEGGIIPTTISLVDKIEYFQNGGQLYKETTISLVDESEYIELFKDGGSINKEPRTLQQLIEYAKEENPRFIQRLSESPKGIDFVDDNGEQSRGSHYLEWSEDDQGDAIIYPRIQEIDGELQFFNSKDAYNRALENKNYLIMTPEEAEIFFAEDPNYETAYKSGWPQFFNKFQKGGSINVIPEGALHARKHNMDIEGITKKGIPVVSEDSEGNIEQQAEVERSEVVFRLEVTKKIEELSKIYFNKDSSKEDKENAALEAGRLLTNELLNNTVDNTGELL